jgi:hypothetical protein
LPTADKGKGLGTGEFDESVGVEFWKTVRDPWAAIFDFGYTFIGDPSGEPLHDVWNFALGGGYSFRKNLLGTLTYEESRALVSGNDNPRDLVLGVSFLPKETVQLSGTLQFGLSDGSADVGLGANVSLKFADFRLP